MRDFWYRNPYTDPSIVLVVGKVIFGAFFYFFLFIALKLIFLVGAEICEKLFF